MLIQKSPNHESDWREDRCYMAHTADWPSVKYPWMNVLFVIRGSHKFQPTLQELWACLEYHDCDTANINHIKYRHPAAIDIFYQSRRPCARVIGKEIPGKSSSRIWITTDQISWGATWGLRPRTAKGRRRRRMFTMRHHPSNRSVTTESYYRKVLRKPMAGWATCHHPYIPIKVGRGL